MITTTLFPGNRTQTHLAATHVLALLVAATTDPKVHALLVLWAQVVAQAVVDARAAHRAKQGLWRARYDELEPLDKAADGALRFAEAAIEKKLGAEGVALFHRLLNVARLSDVTGGPLAKQYSLVEDLRARVEAEPDAHGLPLERLEEVFATNAALGAGIAAEQEAKRAWKAAAAALAEAEDNFRDGYRVLVRSVVQLLGETGAAAILPSFTRSRGGGAQDAAAPENTTQTADGDDADGDVEEG
ncbi:hypothetical protein L6R46_02865 [Myxococcota bacterium]|nr:hypothetical protein [Myxococcota bacterium]